MFWFHLERCLCSFSGCRLPYGVLLSYPPYPWWAIPFLRNNYHMFWSPTYPPYEGSLWIVRRATYELDSVAYMWTDIPAPDDPFWDTGCEGDQVVRVCRKSRLSRWGRRVARPAATCTTHGW